MKISKIPAITLLGLILASLSYANDSTLAHECIENANKQACQTLITSNALSSLKECVATCQSIGIDGWCPKSCNSIGVLYTQIGDYNQAMAYFKKSISLGNENPYFHFPYLHYKSGNMETLQMLDTKCNQSKDKESQAIACTMLGNIYLKGRGVFGRGKGVGQNYAQAFKYLKKSCDLGNGLGCVYIGDMYLYGYGTRLNTQLAKDMYGKACDLGNQSGCNKYNNF